MYTLLCRDDNSLVTTVRERIIQKSSLVDSFQILVPPTYKGHDMSTFTAYIEYVLPISKEYKSETLVMSAELYKDHLQYVLPFDTTITKEFGALECQVSFVKLTQDDQGQPVRYVRKTTPGVIDIAPLCDWSQYVSVEGLTVVDQKILELQSKIEQLKEIVDVEHIAADIAIDEENERIKLSNIDGELLGDGIEFEDIAAKLGETDLDDIKVIEF